MEYEIANKIMEWVMVASRMETTYIADEMWETVRKRIKSLTDLQIAIDSLQQWGNPNGWEYEIANLQRKIVKGEFAKGDHEIAELQRKMESGEQRTGSRCMRTY